MKILLTGCAGFIGAFLTIELLKSDNNHNIVGIDNLNDYYDVSLKKHRLSLIEEVAKKAGEGKWIFEYGDISDKAYLSALFDRFHPEIVINLAAQAGVRYSITNPDVYIRSNIDGFFNILECCRSACEKKYGFKHLIFASSSSVYGNNNSIPFRVSDKTDEPVSLYAATKKSNELMAYTYSKLYGIPATGLRFFTVYGPAGRPDMAYFLFAEKLRKGEKITVFNHGKCERDFTYIDDITAGIVSVIKKRVPEKEKDFGINNPKYKIYNIGNGHPQNLMEFISVLKEELVEADVLPRDFDLENSIEMVEAQPGDVDVTYADMENFKKDFGYEPFTDLRTGLHRFATWYSKFYK